MFEKRYINSHPEAYPYADNDERPWTWYNPHRDIIVFGEDTCIRTVVDVFREKANEKYARVAFRCANVIGTCERRCGFDTWEYPHGDDIELCLQGLGIGGGGVDIMDVLHGVDADIALNTMVPGAPGVEEVFFVVKTECMKFKAGSMPSDSTFRPSIYDGPTAGQERLKYYYQNIINPVRSEEGFADCGEDRWANGNYPDFNFVSLDPPVKVDRGKSLKHDAIVVPTKDIGKLLYRNSKFLYDLGHKTKVDIIPSGKAYPGEKHREIDLYNGTEEGIGKAKEEIQKQLVC